MLNSSQLARAQWVDRLPIYCKGTGLTNRSFITAKTIFFSYTISAKAPSGGSTAQCCRLSAPRSVQDDEHSCTAVSSLCFCCCAALKHQTDALPEPAANKPSCSRGPRDGNRLQTRGNNRFSLSELLKALDYTSLQKTFLYQSYSYIYILFFNTCLCSNL